MIFRYLLLFIYYIAYYIIWKYQKKIVIQLHCDSITFVSMNWFMMSDYVNKYTDNVLYHI